VNRFLRYLLVAVAATAAHYALMAFCIERGGWPAFAASGVGAALGAQVAYVGNRWFTFEHRGAMGASWPRFQATALAGALLGMAIVAAGVALGMHYLVAQMIATGTSVFLTFAINRHWTFADAAAR
jgi:putative flippase GtrA